MRGRACCSQRARVGRRIRGASSAADWAGQHDVGGARAELHAEPGVERATALPHSAT